MPLFIEAICIWGKGMTWYYYCY